MGDTNGAGSGSRDQTERVSAWQSDAYPPLELTSRGNNAQSPESGPASKGSPRQRGPVRLALYLLLIAALGVAAYLGGPAVVSWAQGLFSEPEAVPVSEKCVSAFSVAIETEAVEDRVNTLQNCTESDWKSQQATTPMGDVKLSELCAFRGELDTETCANADAQRLIQANIDAQNTTTTTTTTSIPTNEGYSSPSNGYSSGVRRQTPVPSQVTPPQYTPQPVQPPVTAPSQSSPPAYSNPSPSGGGGSPGPSFSPSAPPGSPGPSF